MKVADSRVSCKQQTERRVLRPLIVGSLVGGFLVGVGAAAAERPTNTPRPRVEPAAEVEDPLAWIEGPMDCGRIESKIRSRYGLGVESFNALQPLLREEFRFVKEETCTNTKYGSCGFVWCGPESAAAKKAAPATVTAKTGESKPAAPPVAKSAAASSSEIDDLLAEETARLEAGRAEQAREAAGEKQAQRTARASLRVDPDVEAILEENSADLGDDVLAEEVPVKAAPTVKEVASAPSVKEVAPAAVAKQIALEPVAADAIVDEPIEDEVATAELDLADVAPVAKSAAPAKAAVADIAADDEEAPLNPHKQVAEKEDLDRYAALIPAGTKGFVRKDGAFVPVPFEERRAEKTATTLAQLDRDLVKSDVEALSVPPVAAVPAAEAAQPVTPPVVEAAAPVAPAAIVPVARKVPAVATAPAPIGTLSEQSDPSFGRVKPLTASLVISDDAEAELARRVEELKSKRQLAMTNVIANETAKGLVWKVIEVPGASMRQLGGGKDEDAASQIAGKNKGDFGRTIVPGGLKAADTPENALKVLQLSTPSGERTMPFVVPSTIPAGKELKDYIPRALVGGMPARPQGQ